MKLKIKFFLWQLWLTLVVWAAFFSVIATEAKGFWLTVLLGPIALYIVYGVLSLDFSDDYHRDNFFSHSWQIGNVIEKLAEISAFFGAVLAGLISLAAYSIFDDEYVAMAPLGVFAMLCGFLLLSRNKDPLVHSDVDWREYISKRYFYTYLVVGSLSIAIPMLLWYIIIYQGQVKATLGS